MLPDSNQSRSDWPSNDLPRPTLHDEEIHGFYHKGEDTKAAAAAADPKRSSLFSNRNFIKNKKHVLNHAATSELNAVSHLRLEKQQNYLDFHVDSGRNTTTALDAFYITNSTGIRFSGGGTIDGKGFMWWWDCIITGIDRRPYLIMMRQVEDIYIGDLTLKDSPMYHVYLYDTKTILVEYVKIHVNIWGQFDIQMEGKARTRRALLAAKGLPEAEVTMLVQDEKKVALSAEKERRGFKTPREEHGQNKLFGEGIPLLGDYPSFPLNTDGIDIAGVDVVVRHCDIENYDDALCPKPLNGQSRFGPCSRNQHWYNHTIRFGVGASVGSVPPNLNVNCIADVVFENLNFTHALKTMYIKPNPCPHGEAIDGTGIINNITYKDVVTTNPITWPIWFSTQQQKQPGDGTDTGCSFLYPLPGTSCPTYPCVPITNVLLKNVTSIDSLLSPGVIRCNAANPCKNITFDGVNISKGLGFPWGMDSYLCEAIDDFKFIGGSTPSKCIYNYTV